MYNIHHALPGENFCGRPCTARGSIRSYIAYGVKREANFKRLKGKGRSTQRPNVNEKVDIR